MIPKVPAATPVAAVRAAAVTIVPSSKPKPAVEAAPLKNYVTYRWHERIRLFAGMTIVVAGEVVLPAWVTPADCDITT
jgi:hypothetical protein